MRPHEESEAKVISTNNFGQPRVLGVVEAEATEFSGDLKSESPKFAHSLKKVVLFLKGHVDCVDLYRPNWTLLVTASIPEFKLKGSKFLIG